MALTLTLTKHLTRISENDYTLSLCTRQADREKLPSGNLNTLRTTLSRITVNCPAETPMAFTLKDAAHTTISYGYGLFANAYTLTIADDDTSTTLSCIGVTRGQLFGSSLATAHTPPKYQLSVPGSATDSTDFYYTTYHTSQLKAAIAMVHTHPLFDDDTAVSNALDRAGDLLELPWPHVSAVNSLFSGTENELCTLDSILAQYADLHQVDTPAHLLCDGFEQRPWGDAVWTTPVRPEGQDFSYDALFGPHAGLVSTTTATLR